MRGNLFNFDYLILRRHLNLEYVVEKSADTLHFLYELDGGGEDGTLYSLDKLAKENFGEGKTAKASTIPKLLKEGKLAEVLVYNEHDCDLTFRIWWKMVSERKISVGEVWSESSFEGDYELTELIYDLEEKDISVLTCATPRFTYTTWVERLEKDGWIVMPPRERKRRERERERIRMQASEASRKRNQAMQEFIKQHFRDDIPRKFTQPRRDDTPLASPASDVAKEVQDVLTRAGLPRNAWIEGVVSQLLRGEYVYPTELELVGRPNDPEQCVEVMKSILVALLADGYTLRYLAGSDPGHDSFSLAGPPPTLAEQYIQRMSQHHAEMEALYGTAGISFSVTHWASGVHRAHTDAMKVLRGDEYLVFVDGSYVLDTEDVELLQLQPKVLTSKERTDLEVYIQNHSIEFLGHEPR